MNEDVFIVAIVFGSIASIVFLSIIGSIIKAWVKKGDKSNLSENREFLNALREFKEKMEERVSNLEAIVSEEEKKYAPKKLNKKSKDNQDSIKIELDDETTKQNEGEKSSKLKNMLNQ